MNSTRMPALAGSLLVLVGCATGYPMSAAEYRDAAKTSMFANAESFEVDRSYRDVAKSFEQQAAKCLNVRVATTERVRGAPMTYHTDYKATVVLDGQRAELHLQQDDKHTIKPYAAPEGGIYVIVADATPVSANKSRVDIYAGKIGHSGVKQAIRNWAGGESGCPDMTKVL